MNVPFPTDIDLEGDMEAAMGGGGGYDGSVSNSFNWPSDVSSSKVNESIAEPVDNKQTFGTTDEPNEDFMLSSMIHAQIRQDYQSSSRHSESASTQPLQHFSEEPIEIDYQQNILETNEIETVEQHSNHPFSFSEVEPLERKPIEEEDISPIYHDQSGATMISYSRSTDYYLSSERSDFVEGENSNHTLETLEEIERENNNNNHFNNYIAQTDHEPESYQTQSSSDAYNYLRSDDIEGDPYSYSPFEAKEISPDPPQNPTYPAYGQSENYQTQPSYYPQEEIDPESSVKEQEQYYPMNHQASEDPSYQKEVSYQNSTGYHQYEQSTAPFQQAEATDYSEDLQTYDEYQYQYDNNNPNRDVYYKESLPSSTFQDDRHNYDAHHADYYPSEQQAVDEQYSYQPQYQNRQQVQSHHEDQQYYSGNLQSIEAANQWNYTQPASSYDNYHGPSDETYQTQYDPQYQYDQDQNYYSQHPPQQEDYGTEYHQEEQSNYQQAYTVERYTHYQQSTEEYQQSYSQPTYEEHQQYQQQQSYDYSYDAYHQSTQPQQQRQLQDYYDQHQQYPQYPSSYEEGYPLSSPTSSRQQIQATHNTINPDISSDSEDDVPKQKRKQKPQKPAQTTLSRPSEQATTFLPPVDTLSSISNEPQETSHQRSYYYSSDQREEPPISRPHQVAKRPAASIVSATNHPQVPPTTTSSSAIAPPDVEKKIRHLQIWERFFENAAKLSDSEGGGGVGATVSSDHSVSGVGGRSSSSARMKLGSLLLKRSSHDSYQASSSSAAAQQAIDTGFAVSEDPLAEEEGGEEERSSEIRVDFNSSLGKQYFTFAIAAEQTWPVLISSKKYQALIALAKASLGTPAASNSPLPALAFMAAIIIADVETVNTFLMRGINPNCRDQLGRTAVHHAARVGSDQLVALLLDSNADLDLPDEQEMTPLHIAVTFNRVAVVRFLLDSAVEVQRKNGQNMTALEIALYRKHTDCEQLLKDFLQYSTINSFDQLTSNHHPSDSDNNSQIIATETSLPSYHSPPLPSSSSTEAINRGNKPGPILLHPSTQPTSFTITSSASSSLSHRAMIPEINPHYLIDRTITESSDDELAHPLPPSSFSLSRSVDEGHQREDNKKHSDKKESSQSRSNNHKPPKASSSAQLSTSSSNDPIRRVSFDLNKFKQMEKEILEKRKVLEQRLLNPSSSSVTTQQPDNNNSDDDYEPMEPTPTVAKNQTMTRPSPLSIEIPSTTTTETNKTLRKKNEPQEEEEEEEGDDEDNSEISSAASSLSSLSMMMDRLSASIWSFAISIITLALFFLFNGSPSSSSSSSSSKRRSRRKRGSDDDEDEEEDEALRRLGIGSPTALTPQAPPTDEELLRRGNSHRVSTISPTGAEVVAPQDVQLAIAMSKVGKRLVGSPVAASKEMAEDVKKEIANRYSLGSQLPQGTSWRYVNLMNVSEHPKSSF